MFAWVVMSVNQNFYLTFLIFFNRFFVHFVGQTIAGIAYRSDYQRRIACILKFNDITRDYKIRLDDFKNVDEELIEKIKDDAKAQESAIKKFL